MSTNYEKVRLYIIYCETNEKTRIVKSINFSLTSKKYSVGCKATVKGE